MSANLTFLFLYRDSYIKVKPKRLRTASAGGCSGVSGGGCDRRGRFGVVFAAAVVVVVVFVGGIVVPQFNRW